MSSEVNRIHLNFARKFGPQKQDTIFYAQKIKVSKLDTFDMLTISFSVDNKERRFCFFKKVCLLADIIIDIALGILFFGLRNVEIDLIS